MQFSDAVVINAPCARVWLVLSDPQVIGACVPGLEEVEVNDDGLAFGGQANIELGSTALSFPTTVRWIEQNAPHGGNLKASAELAGFEIEGHGNIVLAETGTDDTTLAWDATVLIPETLAGNPLMVRMVRMFATRFFQGFFHCVQQRLEAV